MRNLHEMTNGFPAIEIFCRSCGRIFISCAQQIVCASRSLIPVRQSVEPERQFGSELFAYAFISRSMRR
jgi:hypothetical protein